MHRSLLSSLRSPDGPLGVFVQYPVLLRLAVVSVCAEIAWATLIIVLQYHFKDDVLRNQAQQLIVARVATVTFAFVACETILKYPMGALSDRFGPRPMIFFALILATISPLLMTQASEWWHFVPLRALDGIAAAALWPAMSSLMARSVPRQAKSAAMSVFNGAYCAGLAVGPMAGLFLGHHFGNKAVFPLCALVLVLGLIIAATVLTGGVGNRAEFKPDGGIDLLRKPQLLKMMALYALSQCAVGMMANVFVIFMDNQFNIHEGDLPKLIVGPALFIGAIALPIGHMADKIGRARAVWISYVLAVAGMLIVASSSLFEPTKTWLSLPLFIFGTGLFLLIASYILGTPAWLGLASLQVDEAHQAKAMSLMQTSQGLGLVLGSGLVMTSSALLVRSENAYLALDRRLPGLHLSERGAHFIEMDAMPIEFWLWAAAFVFLLCLIGCLLWVREPEHDYEEVLSQQPPTLSEV
ncbi:MAG TPA: MFS transporter [Abditibacteriaceae bacterium]|jgi:MFS family permease